MSNFVLVIDQESFAEHDVRVDFDDDLYAELLQEFQHAEDEREPVLHIEAHPRFNTTQMGRRLTLLAQSLSNNKSTTIAGSYIPAYDFITSRGYANLDLTNNILLHESKHFVDSYTDTQKIKQDIREGKWLGQERLLLGALGGVGISAVLYGAGRRQAAAVAMTSSLAAGRISQWRESYWKLQHEVDARDFAADPEIVAEFGRIITYTQL